MCNLNPESLHEIIKSTAIEVLGVSEEAASIFARIATSKVTGFLLRFDNVPEHLELQDIVFDGERFIARWISTSKHANCPMCGKESEKEHSSYLYKEMIQDVGINGIALWHEIHRKKYICTNDHCLQTRFMEGFPGFVETRYARMTTDFTEHILSTAANTSSSAAERILRGQGAEIGRDTINNVILRRGAIEIEKNFYDTAGEVIKAGIDDINLRKGDSSTSCMVIVNLETGKLLGIARGTTAETAQEVLSMFPNLEIVSRDRGTAMASAANTLGKESVADRYHISANIHDAIERTLYENLPKSMYIPVGDSWVCLSNDSENGDVLIAEVPASLNEKDITLRVRMAHLSPNADLTYRNTLRVLELTMQGKHAEEISGIMGIALEEVRKLRNGMRETVANVEKKIDEYVTDPHGSVQKQKSVSVSARDSRKSKVEPYRDIVVAMRKEGKSHWTIHEEICKLGFIGSHSTVDNFLIKLERECSIDAEIEAKRKISNDYFGAFPDRPGKISVSIFSAKTVYNIVIAKIKEHRHLDADKEQTSVNDIQVIPQLEKKTLFRQVSG